MVQRYIHQPLLLEGFKFDLRIYVLVACCDPLRIFWYNDGLVRMATIPYKEPTQKNIKQSCMHLTNFAINKHNENYEYNEDEQNDFTGHKRSMKSLFKILEDREYNVFKLKQEIKGLVIKTLISG